MDKTERNYTSISPSARALLLMKGFTDIPFARQAAALMVAPEKYEPDFENRELGFWARVLHFENRYWSIDQLLSELPTKNILELSSGFSLRGLDMIQRKGYYYIDTDLPDVIATKKDFAAALQEKISEDSTLEILPLNALDEKQFDEIITHFPEGPIAIINEGLLMYLGMEEKEKLCGIIYKALNQHGGCWITADVYVKNEKADFNLKLKMSEQEKTFFEQHNIEENKFESFEAAEAFFSRMGFIVDEIAQPDPSKLISLKYLTQSMTEEQKAKMGTMDKIQATWRLRIKPE
jgi:O-methyltransferase involved in polyketide biosynthesis